MLLAMARLSFLILCCCLFFVEAEIPGLSERFNALDINHDGVLDEFELSQTNQEGAMTPEQFKAMFAAMDSSKDKKITFHEFVEFSKAAQRMNKATGPQMPPPGQPNPNIKPKPKKKTAAELETQAKEVFKIFDKDKNGWLSMQEYMLQADPMSPPEALKDVRKNFKRFDYDKNGQLEEKELIEQVLVLNKRKAGKKGKKKKKSKKMVESQMGIKGIEL